MTTQKHKVQGYVERHCFEAFSAFWQENQLSQSQALELLLNRALGVSQDVPKPSPLEERVTKLEDELHYLKGLLLVMRGEQLQNKSNLNGNSVEEPLPILEAIKPISPVIEQDEPQELETAETKL